MMLSSQKAAEGKLIYALHPLEISTQQKTQTRVSGTVFAALVSGSEPMGLHASFAGCGSFVSIGQRRESPKGGCVFLLLFGFNTK